MKILRNIFLLSIPIFILHGMEEYITGFTQVDPIFLWVFRPLLDMSVNQATFLVFQIMLGVLLIVSALLILGEKWQRRMIIIPGLLYIFEFHHLYEAIIRKTYYPGLITALFFPFVAFFFWKAYFKNS